MSENVSKRRNKVKGIFPEVEQNDSRMKNGRKKIRVLEDQRCFHSLLVLWKDDGKNTGGSFLREKNKNFLKLACMYCSIGMRMMSTHTQ